MPDERITSLSGFMERVQTIRERWKVQNDKELWFRGEAEKYETCLRPKLYRSAKGETLKPSKELLEIENRLYEYFERCGAPLCDTPLEEDNQDWDWYFLIQHHGAPTRLLDWSDGALIALHFAVRDKKPDDHNNACVYVIEPDELQKQIKALPEMSRVKQQWKYYVEKHPSYQHDADEWEGAWLPHDEEEREELKAPETPSTPLVLEIPHITRRVAAQRSRFILFGTEPDWLSKKLTSKDPLLETIIIDGNRIVDVKVQLRDSGVTESVVFPDLDGLGREVNQLWQELKSSKSSSAAG